MNGIVERLKRLSGRRFFLLSPQITILGVIAVLLFAAVIGLGVAIVRESISNQALINYNRTDVMRPFPQLQREMLKLLALVAQPPEEFDAKKVQLQRDLVESRWRVVDFPPVIAVMPPELLDDLAEARTRWTTLNLHLDEWTATPTNTTVQREIEQELNDLEFLLNSSEIRFQQERNFLLGPIGEYSELLLIVLIVVLLLLVLFLALGAYSTYRFVQARQRAEEEARLARAAEVAAIESNRFKDQFLAVMSHELRTPLNAIIGFLGVVNMLGQVDDGSRYRLGRARANAERLLNLINDILEISRIEAGRLELVPTHINIRQLAERLRSQMGVLAEEKGLTLNVQIEESMPETVFADEEAVMKISTNLLSNAFKFTEKGSVTLDIRCDGSTRWVIEVSDTGIGIPAHMHGVIFERFRQVDGSTTRAYGGSGLGLAITHQLCDAMNGVIRLNSTPGEGSTFTVILPLEMKALPALVGEKV